MALINVKYLLPNGVEQQIELNTPKKFDKIIDKADTISSPYVLDEYIDNHCNSFDSLVEWVAKKMKTADIAVYTMTGKEIHNNI